MIYCKWLSRLFFVVGMALFVRAQMIPVYTDPDAPARLSRELMTEFPRPDQRQERFQQWDERLKHYETRQKMLSDVGRCLIAMAAGLWLSRIIWGKIWSQSGLMAVWMGLWLLLIPFSWWSDRLRDNRFDFPEWSNRDAARFYQRVEVILWPVAGGVTMLILLPLMWGRLPPGEAAIWKPIGAWSWIRAGFLWLWIAGLVWLVGESIYFGEEAPVISGFGAVAVLLRIMSLPSVKRSLPNPPAEKAGRAVQPS